MAFFEGCHIVYNENKRRTKFKEMKREKMNLSKIHHIAIIVSDYEAAKNFYVNKLGFSVIRENYRPEREDWKLELRVNEHTELEIFAEENPPKRVNRPEACGLRHLAFCVDSVEQTVNELEEVGIECEPIRVDDYTGKKREELYVLADGDEIAACIIANDEKVEGYADAPWQIDSDEVIVLHVLAVHPDYRGKGLARRLVENVIEQERKAGKKALRLDVIENNTTAEKLYQKLGFRYIQTKTLYYDVVGKMTFKLYELVL